MKIVVLNEYTENPGVLSREELGKLTACDRTRLTHGSINVVNK